MDRTPVEPQRRRSPANRLGLDYRDVPPRKVDCPLIDVHTHIKTVEHAGVFFEAALAYGISRVVSMSPLDQVDALRAAYGDRMAFVAIPRWEEFEPTLVFRDRWLADLGAFRDKGARLCKFWSAPQLRQMLGLTLDHPVMRPVVEGACDLGYDFMVHVGDPSVWWQPGGKYAESRAAGTKREQYGQLEWFLERVAPRKVIAAHMGGYVEDVRFLQDLLGRYPNLLLDTSATKWMVREIARQPDAVREFVIRNQDRILFGTDLVVDEGYNFDALPRRKPDRGPRCRRSAALGRPRSALGLIAEAVLRERAGIVVAAVVEESGGGRVLLA